MIKFLRDERYQLFWFFFHALLGFVSIKSRYPLIIWFYIVTIGFIVKLFSKKEPQLNILCYLGYLLGFEVLARGVGATPLIPYEIGKYAAFVCFLIGSAMGGPIKKISYYGVVMILLSLPGILISKFSLNGIIFNYLGPLSLFLGVIFCSRQVITYQQFRELSRLMVYSIFSLACFAIFKASTFEKITYTVYANFRTAGGAATNQVSTLFGTALCILALMFLTGQRLFKYRIMDLSLVFLFAIRGLLTFSRGGMVSAALSIIVMMLIPRANSAWQDNEIKMRSISPTSILIMGLVLVGSFYLVNSFTDNFLLYRYEGRTERSLQTGFENDADLNQLTSGRVAIFQSDIAMFFANPVFGVGVGQSKFERGNFGGAAGFASHIELSRLLAEHGMFGLAIVLLMYIYPFLRIFQEPNNYKRMIIVSLLVMSLSITFHNAMRTLISPLLFSLVFLKIVPTDFDWRAQLKSKMADIKVKASLMKPKTIK